MGDNQFYEAALDGRWPLDIELHEQEDGWVAQFKSVNGRVVEARDADPQEASRRCAGKVLKLIRGGEITPYDG